MLGLERLFLTDDQSHVPWLWKVIPDRRKHDVPPPSPAVGLGESVLALARADRT